LSFAFLFSSIQSDAELKKEKKEKKEKVRYLSRSLCGLMYVISRDISDMYVFIFYRRKRRKSAPVRRRKKSRLRSRLIRRPRRRRYESYFVYWGYLLT